jgi:hypothetical protein
MATADAEWLTLDGTRFEERSFSRVWLVAAATYGVGDIVTTITIIWFIPWFTEANPVIRVAIEAFGGGGFLALKLLVFYAAIGISLWGGLLDDDPVLFYGPPVVLTIFGVLTTVLNLSLLFN